ncbi:MAG: thioredoxin family protein [Desulfobacterales bacterium]|nr:thioredoxin family protein [Desulfobacterales bacterium]
MIHPKLLSKAVAILIMVFCMLQGCGKSASSHNPYVANMNDFSYSGQLTDDSCVFRVNALGEEVCVAEFQDWFVWVDYSAPWCSPCNSQAKVIKLLENEMGDTAVFLTVMTSETAEFQSIPTRKTAKRWAQRFRLNPARVVVANDKWGMTIPTHILFSPTGQTIYRAKGFHSKDQILEIMDRYMRDWKNWSENGAVADWMKTG